ncbi:zinc finger CCCH domain-containing protein 13-like isoform X2 [Mya arenaria]|uniref:zinc finger CCCH domain-containing protein 13-like isoform X2 n=1 Tax=Mya arenaria TaxID=6604 RepID=UPI0022E931A9|nr:zinc finger CCCH domain-containing protein 13-like isoform X2 [Mya arenaria]XP_052764478.1 zinc finger CCCH domain-containing protein 13-like isoform X2 [Mya arenaria]
MPQPRRASPRNKDRRSRSYSPRRQRSRSRSYSRDRSRSRERRRSPPRKRSPERSQRWSPRHRSQSSERDYARQQVKPHSGDIPDKRSARRSRTPSPYSRDKKLKQETSPYDHRRRSPSPGPSRKSRLEHISSSRSEHNSSGRSEHVSSARAPLFPSAGTGKKREIDYVVIVNRGPKMERLNKRFETLEQQAAGPFDFEENITIGIHRGPSANVHLYDDEDVPVNYDFNTKTFKMLHRKKYYEKAIFDRDEIKAFHHDDILDEEAYVEKRTISVKPVDKPRRDDRRDDMRDEIDFRVTHRTDRDDPYVDRRMVRSHERSQRYEDIPVTVRLDPKPDPRYERIYRSQQRHGDQPENFRDPGDLRNSLLRRKPEGGMVDARSRIDARRMEEDDVSPDRHSQDMDRKRSSYKQDLPDFKNRPESPVERWGFCTLCQLSLYSEIHANEHVESAQHQLNERLVDEGLLDEETGLPIDNDRSDEPPRMVSPPLAHRDISPLYRTHGDTPPSRKDDSHAPLPRDRDISPHHDSRYAPVSSAQRVHTPATEPEVFTPPPEVTSPPYLQTSDHRQKHEKRSQYDYTQNERRSYTPNERADYTPSEQADYTPNERADYTPDERKDYTPNERRNYTPTERRESGRDTHLSSRDSLRQEKESVASSQESDGYYRDSVERKRDLDRRSGDAFDRLRDRRESVEKDDSNTKFRDSDSERRKVSPKEIAKDETEDSRDSFEKGGKSDRRSRDSVGRRDSVSRSRSRSSSEESRDDVKYERESVEREKDSAKKSKKLKKQRKDSEKQKVKRKRKSSEKQKEEEKEVKSSTDVKKEEVDKSLHDDDMSVSNDKSPEFPKAYMDREEQPSIFKGGLRISIQGNTSVKTEQQAMGGVKSVEEYEKQMRSDIYGKWASDNEEKETFKEILQKKKMFAKANNYRKREREGSLPKAYRSFIGETKTAQKESNSQDRASREKDRNSRERDSRSSSSSSDSKSEGGTPRRRRRYSDDSGSRRSARDDEPTCAYRDDRGMRSTGGRKGGGSRVIWLIGSNHLGAVSNNLMNRGNSLSLGLEDRNWELVWLTRRQLMLKLPVQL